jgi:hypothetical protein
VHATAPLALWYWPPGHGVQLELVINGWKEPAAQAVQLAEFGPAYVPTGQVSGAGLVARHAKPALQEMQLVAPGGE